MQEAVLLLYVRMSNDSDFHLLRSRCEFEINKVIREGLEHGPLLSEELSVTWGADEVKSNG